MCIGRIPCLCVCVWTVTSIVFGFNIDTDHHTLLSGPSGSYYGYAVALVKNQWVFVGAPRDNDTTMPTIVEPGTVHKCEKNANGTYQCDVLHIDSSLGRDSVMFDGKSWNLTHGRDHSWLGGSIEVPHVEHGRGIVTCAHKWYNRLSDDVFRMNGLCYEIPLDLTLANIRTIPAMVNASLQVGTSVGGRAIFNFGMASMGTAVHYTKATLVRYFNLWLKQQVLRLAKALLFKDQYLLLGTPGVQDWTGGFLRLSQSVAYSAANVADINETQSQLLGYSASSGRYFADGVMYFTFGIPRSDLTGKVALFRANRSDYSIWTPDFEVTATELDGTEMPINAYFGACLHSVDIDNDGHDDLLVGAPLYSRGPSDKVRGPSPSGQGPSQSSRSQSPVTASQGSSQGAEGIDQGRVFVYFGRNSRTQGFNKLHQVLLGSEASYARFGSAIMGLGDINRDSYQDIAIGAPYEDNMQGAVYIYNGYSGGLWLTYTQRIAATVNIAPNLQGFGQSLSNPADMNEDGVNDIAVGAYLSDNALLLYGQPVMQLTAHMQVTDSGRAQMTGRDPAQLTIIDTNMTQVTVKVCFMFDERSCKRIDLLVTLTLDEEKGGRSRLLFNNSSPTIDTSVRIFRTDLTCTDSVDGTATVKSRHDLVTPVTVVAQYTIRKLTCSSTATINRFDGSNPHNPLMKIVEKLHFKKACPDNICLTDLHVSASSQYSGTRTYFVIGEPAPVIDVNVTLSGHPSYGSVFKLKYPNALLYKKVMKVSGETEARCELEYVDTSEVGFTDTSTLVCEIGNPLYNSGIGFCVQMEWSPSVKSSTLDLYLDVTTQSDEMNATDNSMVLNIDVRNQVDIIFSGIADPDIVFINPGPVNYSTEHVYELDNPGPSPLPTAAIEIFYPLIMDDGLPLFNLVQTKVLCGRPCNANCTLMSYLQSPRVQSWVNGRLINNFEILVIGEEHDTENTMDCTTEKCVSYKCNIADLLPRRTVVLSMEFAIQKKIVNSMTNKNSLKLTSHAFAVLNDSSLITNSTVYEEIVSTDLFPSTPAKGEVSWWIVVVSVACGVLLIVILIAILCKIGFFKRMTQEEMAKLQKERQAQVTKEDEYYT